MKPVAIGVRVHSGWGALVAVAGKSGAEEVLERRRVIIADPGTIGSKQPYHHAAQLQPVAARHHLEKCATDSGLLAVEAMKDIQSNLQAGGFTLVSAGLLQSSAKPLPALDAILSSHPLIHTAEGEFFREAFHHAFIRLKIAVTCIREKELEQHAAKIFGTVTGIRQRMNDMGRLIGPPWTQDEKAAALAAAIVLAQSGRKAAAGWKS